MGTDHTNNQLDTGGEYQQISLAFDLGMPTWHMLRVIKEEIHPQNGTANWIEAIIVAMDLYQSHSEAKKIKLLKIVLITPFTTESDDENLQEVIDYLKNQDMDLIVM